MLRTIIDPSSKKTDECYLLSGPREVVSLYFRFEKEKLKLSTKLLDVVEGEDDISEDYFHYFLSNGFGLGPFDRNIRFET